MVRLTHDVLDSQLMDREGRPCGKVDGIVLVVGEHGTPPRVVALEVGALTLARRLHPRLARWLMRWDELDLTEPERPRLTCRVADLEARLRGRRRTARRSA